MTSTAHPCLQYLRDTLRVSYSATIFCNPLFSAAYSLSAIRCSASSFDPPVHTGNPMGVAVPLKLTLTTPPPPV